MADWADIWTAWASRTDVSREGNPYHVAAGKTGGQFTSAAGVGAGGYTKDWDSPGTLYHGTDKELQPGDHVHTNYGWAHATTSKFVAATYARLRGGQNIYEVEPTGPVELDTRNLGGIGATSSYRSRSHYRVVRKLDEKADDIYFGTLGG